MHVNPILVVDDNAQIVDILSQYIKKEGWPMLAAKTGEEALALFDAAEPSLILLDIMLRGSSGFEVAEKEMLVIGELSIHLPSLSVTLSGHKLNLTRREVELLYTLAASPGRVFTRDNLLTIVWGYEFAGNYRAVDSHIKRLRAKLDAYPHDTFTIATVWGAGYKFERNLP